MGRPAATDKKVAKIEPTMGERFTAMVIKEANALVGGGLQLSLYQKQLAQHLFIKVDQALQTAGIEWKNVNMPKLAVDAIHRINLGLDALIPNHISPIPYRNSKTNKYDLDLRIGYVGQNYYRQEMAVEKPVDIVYELVYSNDTFRPIKKGYNCNFESYEFEITNPWDRGKIIGGFGYIMYQDSRKNKLVIVTEADFKRAEAHAKANDFWAKYPVEMRFKTLVHRVTSKLTIDPAKINESYAAVERDDQETVILAEIEEKENKEPLDTAPPEATSQQEPEQPEEQQETPNPDKTGTSGPGF